jgi:hypothetical protein
VVIDLDGFAVGPNRPVKVAWWLIASRMLARAAVPGRLRLLKSLIG